MNTYRLNFANHSQTIDCHYNIKEIFDFMMNEEAILVTEHYDKTQIIINMSKVENITVKEDK